jgi:BioD-like phosphotransacetylase family protein
MKKLVFASTKPNAGKTSLIVGLAKALGKSVGYAKPLGDRLLYKKKRQWDYDSAVVVSQLGLTQDPEVMTIGFEHSKLRYMYDDDGIRGKLAELVSSVGDKDLLCVETGCTLNYGISVFLDAASVAKAIGGELVVVVSGTDDEIVDDITFLKRYAEVTGAALCGVIVNKVRDKSDFVDAHMPTIEEVGVPVLGVVPYREELTYLATSYLADKLFAKVLAGENAMNGMIKHIVVGAMSVDAAMNSSAFKGEAKLVITSGDRADMILAAIDTKASAVLLSNNILPPGNIIARANEAGVPLLLVKSDTFAVAKQIDDMQPLLTRDDIPRANFLAGLVKEHIKLEI